MSNLNLSQIKSINWKKIGILGGTFNPIHNGHLLLAQWAMEEACLDGVLFIPTGNSYMKDSREILSPEERVTMTSLAVSDRDCFLCSDLEANRSGNTYTYETLETLHKLYPSAELFFIIGADCLFSIENWYHPDRIFSNCTLLAASRNGMPMDVLEQKRQYLSHKYNATIRLISFPNMEISSTDIRHRVKIGKSIQYLVPDSVKEYIQTNNYYRG